MIQRKFKIKDGVLLETKEVRIEDRTKLFKYNPNLKMLAEDISRSRKDEHLKKLSAEGSGIICRRNRKGKSF
jgi:hypothetical protein